jgi:hypothetical protein
MRPGGRGRGSTKSIENAKPEQSAIVVETQSNKQKQERKYMEIE